MNENELSSFGDWELKHKLGSGGFGEVRLWRNRCTNQEIATKRCLRDRNSMHDDEIDKLKKRWLQEYNWMLNLKTDYIVHGIQLDDASFLAYLNAQHGAWRQLPIIVMEYCNGGDLRKELLKIENCNGLLEYEVRQVMHALRHAIEYLHNECRIEHRDLKPDNIVMHCVGNEKIYKLTDFGFSREVLDQTCVASIVGTQNYIAPEIVDTSKYTKTVDYWSLGVIAFELMCGQLPFIPHQTLLHKITNIKLKPASCIAITEDPLKRDQFNFVSTIFQENRMSHAFQCKMEAWLCLALDKDYRTRGGSRAITDVPPQLPTPRRIFDVLDEILQCKILTVFTLNTYQLYSFEVSADMSMHQLMAQMEIVISLQRRTFFFIFPTGHPVKQVSAQTRPIDLYVESWLDTAADSGNPPAMLYLLSYQGDYNACDPYISPLIKQCIAASELQMPSWAQQQLAVQTHFLLSNEQRHLAALLYGLLEYAFTVEDEIFHFEPRMNELKEQIAELSGCMLQFNVMVEQAKAVGMQMAPAIVDKLFALWDSKLQTYTNKLHKIQTNVGQSIQKRYNSASRRIKEQAKNKYLNEFAKEDIFKVNDFRTVVANWKQYPADYNLPELCRETVYACLEQRAKFLSSHALQEAKTTITNVHEEFRKIRAIVTETIDYVLELKTQLRQETGVFMQQLLEFPLCQKMNSLNIWNNASAEQNNTCCVSLDNILNLPTTANLLEESRQQLRLFEMLNEDDVMSINVPTTVNMD